MVLDKFRKRRMLNRVRRTASELEETMVDDETRALALEDQKREIEDRQAWLEWLNGQINAMESELLLSEAETWGIEMPTKPECYVPAIKTPDSFKMYLRTKGDSEVGDEVPTHLSRQGRTMITKQIRDARRANAKWWVEVLTPVLALAVAFLSLFKDIIIEVLKNAQK